MNGDLSSNTCPSLEAKIETLTGELEGLKQRHERYSLLIFSTCLAALLTSNFCLFLYKLVLDTLSFEAFVNNALVGLLGAILASLAAWLGRAIRCNRNASR